MLDTIVKSFIVKLVKKYIPSIVTSQKYDPFPSFSVLSQVCEVLRRFCLLTLSFLYSYTESNSILYAVFCFYLTLFKFNQQYRESEEDSDPNKRSNESVVNRGLGYVPTSC